MSKRGLAGSSAIMFSGTLTSRVLGLVRNALLVAAIGATAGQADPFAVANTLPNIIYNLLAGGVLNAVLVPQVVRALQRRNSEDYVNRLLTMAGIGLFVITLIATAASALLVTLYASQMNPAWFNLAVAFAFWCIPQIFFYGIYTLLGQVLNAKESFGPYMWAPVANNIVAIIGLVIYLWIFGFARDGSGANPADWTAGRIALLAGFATLGVAVQAIVLAIALRRTGFRYRFKLGTAGLGGASRMALWSFAALAVGQIGFLAVTNVAAAANGAASELGAVLPANYTFDNAFLIYMLPQSLFTTSLITALFPRMSAKAAKGDHEAVSADFGLGLRVIATITIFMAVVLATLAVPISHVVLPSVTSEEARNVAAVLLPLAIGIPFQGAWSLAQRVFFAYEDARTLFFYSIPMAIIQIVICFAGWKLLAPARWVPMAAWSTTASMVVGFALGYLGLMRIFPHFNHTKTVWTVARLAIAGAAAAAVALIGQRLAPLPEAGGAGKTFLHAVLLCAILGIFMTFTYGIVAHLLGVSDIGYLVTRSLGLVKSVLGKLRPPAAPTEAAAPSEANAESEVADAQGPRIPPRRSILLAPPPPPTLGWASDSDTSGMIPAIKVEWAPVKKHANSSTPPSQRGKHDNLPHNGKQQHDAGKDSVTKVPDRELLAGRYRKETPEDIPPLPLGQWWQAYDEVLGENVSLFHCQQAENAAALIDSARRAWLLHDDRFANITQVDAVDDGAIVVCDAFPQRSLAEAGTLAAGPASAAVGEVAGALETARRRGIHHLALTANHVRLNEHGDMIIVGLGIDGATVTFNDDEDAVERSLQASDKDAGDLQQLWEHLTGNPGTQALAEARNAGEVVEALAPWRPADLEAAFEPLGIKLFARAPKWKPLSDQPAATEVSEAPAGDEPVSEEAAKPSSDETAIDAAPHAGEPSEAGGAHAAESAESAAPIPTLPPPPRTGVQVPHSQREESDESSEDQASSANFAPQWQPKLLADNAPPPPFDEVFISSDELPARKPVHVAAVTGRRPAPLPLPVTNEREADAADTADSSQQAEREASVFAPPASADAEPLATAGAAAHESQQSATVSESDQGAVPGEDEPAVGAPPTPTPDDEPDAAPASAADPDTRFAPAEDETGSAESGSAAAVASAAAPLAFAPAPAQMPPSIAPEAKVDQPEAAALPETADPQPPVGGDAVAADDSAAHASAEDVDSDDAAAADEDAAPALSLPSVDPQRWEQTPQWDDIVAPVATSAEPSEPGAKPSETDAEPGETNVEPSETDEEAASASPADSEAELTPLADSRAKPLPPLGENYREAAAAPLGAKDADGDVAVLSDGSEAEQQTRRAVLSSRTDGATAAAITAAERARIAAEKARAASRRRADESMTRIEGLVERFDGFAAKHQLKLPGEVEPYDASTPLSRRKIDPAPLIIGTFIVLTVIAMVLAVINLLPGASQRRATPVITNETTAAASPSAPASEQSAPPATPQAPKPEISNIDVLDPQGDGAENPELLSRAFDGDGESYWRSRSYVDPKYGMKNGIGLAIHLVAKTNVSGVTLQLHGEGGHVQVTTNVDDPPAGPILGEADMSATTDITFEPTETDTLVIWFETLPTAASDGKNRVELQEITLK